MKASVYIDTTLPSYYVDTRPSLAVHIERTRVWWDRERSHYQVFTSPFTLYELREGAYPNQSSALALAENIPRLQFVPEIEVIVADYLQNYLMPRQNDRDAFHLAFASYYKMDYLLTWNCSHLANVHKRQHIAAINQKLGLYVPIIVTPLELLLDEGGD